MRMWGLAHVAWNKSAAKGINEKFDMCLLARIPKFQNFIGRQVSAFNEVRDTIIVQELNPQVIQ